MLGKELKVELRSRVAINSVGLFSIATLIAVSYQIGPYRIPSADRPHILAALLWVILFFGAVSGLPRTFVKEEDAQTAKTLRLAARPLTVFAGKLLLNFILLVAMKAAVTPLFCVLLGFEVRGVPGLALILVTGALALATATTLIAAIIARASGSSALFAVLAIPLVLPLLVVLIQGTQAASQQADVAAVLPALQMALSLAGATLVASLLLFPVVWRD